MKASISQDRKPHRHKTGLSAGGLIHLAPLLLLLAALHLGWAVGMESLHPACRTGTSSAGQCTAGSDSPGCPASRSSLCPSTTASGLVGGRGEEEGQSQQCGGKQLAARCWRQREESIFLIVLRAAPLEKGSRQRGYRGVGTKAARSWGGQGRAALGGEAVSHQAG